MRRPSDARILCADGVYAATHEFSKNCARGNSAPTDPAALSALSEMGIGWAYASHAPRYRFPKALACVTSGGANLACSPDGAPVEGVVGRGCDASATDVALGVGGPKGLAPYAPDGGIRFADESISR